MRRLALGGLLLLGLALPAPAQVELTWKWKEGDKFYAQVVTAVKQTLVVEGPRGDGAPGAARDAGNDREVRQEYEQTALLSYTVKKANKDGSAELVQRVEGLTVKGPDAAKVDTQLGPRERLADGGAELTLHVGPRGEVTKVEGADKLLERLAGNDSGARRALEEALSPDALKKAASQALGFLPKDKVKAGDNWDRKAELSLGALGRLKVEHRYTYPGKGEGGDKGLERIAFTTAVTGFEPNKGGSSALPFQVTEGNFKSADGKGSALFDAEKGRLVRATSSLRLDGTLTIKNVATTYRTRLEQEQTSTITVMDKPPAK